MCAEAAWCDVMCSNQNSSRSCRCQDGVDGRLWWYLIGRRPASRTRPTIQYFMPLRRRWLGLSAAATDRFRADHWPGTTSLRRGWLEVERNAYTAMAPAWLHGRFVWFTPTAFCCVLPSDVSRQCYLSIVCQFFRRATRSATTISIWWTKKHNGGLLRVWFDTSYRLQETEKHELIEW